MQHSNEPNNNNLLKGYNMLLNFAGSMISHEPTEDFITEFWSNGILRKLPVSSNNPRFIMASSMLRGSCYESSRCGGFMKNDFQRLFNGSETPLAPPYESMFSNSYKMLINPGSLDVQDFYKAYGFKSKIKNKIPDDHLGTELLFLTLLIDKFLGFDDRACIVEMKSEIKRFIQEHLLSWIAQWNDKIQIHSQTTCYKGIGTLIYACVEDVYQILD